jgi:hypothetical protein
MESKTYFTVVDIALVSVFCAVWASLNLTLGPMGFAWFKLPILCDFSVFFTLLLVTWVTGRFGTASLVGIIGSIIVLMIRASPHIIGFAISAILFDILMSANRHKIHLKAYNLTVAALVTMISAYFAGVIIGIFFTEGKALTMETVHWALTVWGGWHLAGGILTVIITLPIIGVLEKANVRRIKNA